MKSSSWRFPWLRAIASNRVATAKATPGGVHNRGPARIRGDARTNPGAKKLVKLDTGSVHFDAEDLRVEGKGGKTRIVPAGEPALAALTRYLERRRHPLAPSPRPERRTIPTKFVGNFL